MTSKIMHYNMAIQRALVFMSPTNSVFAASYPARQDQSYEWIAGLFMIHSVCVSVCVCVCACAGMRTCVNVCLQSLTLFVLQELKKQNTNNYKMREERQ